MRLCRFVFLCGVLVSSVLVFAAPVVTSISPDNGPSGTQVQINGSGFGSSQGSSTVAFYPYSQNGTVLSWSDTQITTTVPSTTVTGGVKVTVGGVASNTTVDFVVPAPQITSISPSSGIVGTQVTVTGSGFQTTVGSSHLWIGGPYATIVSWSNTQIVATVVTGAVTGPVSVNINGITSNQDVVFMMPSPTITQLNPTSGPVGTRVTINGSGFGIRRGAARSRLTI